ncbi:MAG TPA: valine--tRNA ligase [Thermoanaerobaculia bacterium]|nr:valine--tRNA ligase [Thermoanaerobaculia bacterium]
MTQRDELDKRFDPKSYESAWQRRWSDARIFQAEAPSGRPPFCLMIPPPNVTGKLHVGHALQTALQDVLTRWRRMLGYNALFLPGTDHAGISTQLMVERQLASEGLDRKTLGRERFVERAWQWKDLYHGNIRRQLDLLGASCDWSRERFTLDVGLSAAVREAFVRLYREGLISRGEYLVNWSPALGTAISDLEVEMKTVAGKLYHVAYPLEGGGQVEVATTRPETMLGDTAIAFHPDDERYRHLLGRAAILPLVGRRLPFIADSAVEPEFGTGLVKITPFHDPNDFEMARRHQLPGVSVIDQQGRMTEAAGPELAGLDRFAARNKVVERLREQGLLVRVEEHVHNVGHSQRGGEPIEPLVSLQWFCDVRTMAERALAALREGRLRLVPDSFDKTWEHWLSQIKPWCISRQLWWGHQIPAWSSPEGRLFVARSAEEAAAEAAREGVAGPLTQDPDVLDTWFSAALWPFSTLGWPEATVDLATFYPTSVLVTGHDILFFWVARMVMTGLHFTGQVPFATVHPTGLVRDAQGIKMSKMRGNVLDPVDLIDEYGADAVRFTLVSLDSPGRDIPLNREQIAGYRAFGNKIWNAVRFALARVGEARVEPEIETEGLDLCERWILSRLSRVAAEVEERFATFRFDEACNRLYHFFWGDLCDWYIELAKPALSGEAPRPRTGAVLLSVLDRSLRLLHPVMPFLTEELWQRLPGHEAVHPRTICLAPYPRREERWESAEVEGRMEVLIQTVTRLRSLRAELGVPPNAKVTLYLAAAEQETARFLAGQEPLLHFLGRVDSVVFGAAPEGARRDTVAGVSGVEIGLALERQALDEHERGRLARELAKLAGEIARAEQRLGDPQFLAKAPAEVVAGGRARLAAMREREQRLRDSVGGA